jgi:hypothetical protein
MNDEEDVFQQIKEAIKEVEWAGKPDPATMSTPNKDLGLYMRDVLAAVDNVKAARSRHLFELERKRILRDIFLL